LDDPVPIAVDGTLDLHAFRPSDVRELVPEWLEACRAAGILDARVVHGKGTGALRQGVIALLERLPIVAEVRPDRTWGAAVVRLWDPSTDSARVREILLECPRFLAALHAVAAVGPPGAWIGAGAVRNRVWHRLHRRAGEPDDTDVDWHGASDPLLDLRFQGQLLAELDLGWEVIDQARYGAPSAEAGIAGWPETATAVGARLEQGELTLLAPHGLSDLVGMVVRRTPHGSVDVYRQRLAEKRWRARFPWARIATED
jgi:hypothetical protein